MGAALLCGVISMVRFAVGQVVKDTGQVACLLAGIYDGGARSSISGVGPRDWVLRFNTDSNWND